MLPIASVIGDIPVYDLGVLLTFPGYFFLDTLGNVNILRSAANVNFFFNGANQLQGPDAFSMTWITAG